MVIDKDGNDVTATKATNYLLTYSADATNASNYQTATYTTNIPNATMIKIINTAGIAPGEKATLTFDYVVDETPTTVDLNPEKL
ncbi:MAG: hypothetical protein LBO09_00095 [Candidatus Peribacteria bacterium]|jgi:hypothetical protein|nr:hypothetical protein [Candidatus Peribacteria bacterium]